MYYRRKILLALLDAFKYKLKKINLQKLLFLFTQEQDIPNFHFVPYKYGAFSFQANADLNTMIKYNQVQLMEKTWGKIDNKNYLKVLKDSDRIRIINLYDKFKNFSTDDLIRYTYINYPYYAIKSNVAKDKLSETEYAKVLEVVPRSNIKKLYTIGYEGLSSEEYFNKLIQLDIKVLCDVRNFPRSMKYGFSKNQLKNACENLGIKYIHLPELGIVSKKRQELNFQTDYDILFDEYKSTTLKDNIDDQKYILELLDKYDRVALTCFEKNKHQCHRVPLSNSIKNLSVTKLSIQNI